MIEKNLKCIVTGKLKTIVNQIWNMIEKHEKVEMSSFANHIGFGLGFVPGVLPGVLPAIRKIAGLVLGA